MDAVTLRAIYSKRQLYERMVEFWTDHFNIDITDGADALPQDRRRPRGHPPTRARDLPATCSAPAPTARRCSTTSTTTPPPPANPNENYARELMELHTSASTAATPSRTSRRSPAASPAGPGATATPAEPPAPSATTPTATTTAQKIVLGPHHPAPAAACSDGVTVLDILANHPSTAELHRPQAVPLVPRATAARQSSSTPSPRRLHRRPAATSRR